MGQLAGRNLRLECFGWRKNRRITPNQSTFPICWCRRNCGRPIPFDKQQSPLTQCTRAQGSGSPAGLLLLSEYVSSQPPDRSGALSQFGAHPFLSAFRPGEEWYKRCPTRDVHWLGFPGGRPLVSLRSWGLPVGEIPEPGWYYQQRWLTVLPPHRSATAQVPYGSQSHSTPPEGVGD